MQAQQDTLSAPLHAGALSSQAVRLLQALVKWGKGTKWTISLMQPQGATVPPTWGRSWLAKRVPGLVGMNAAPGGADVAGGAMDRGFRGMRGSSVTGAHSTAVKRATRHATLLR